MTTAVHAPTSAPIAKAPPPPRRSERWDRPWKPLAARGEVGLLASTTWNSEYILTVDGFNFVAYFEVLKSHGFVHSGLRTTLAEGASEAFDAVMLKPADGEPRGLSHPLQLVRFDVNSGRGMTDNTAFVMTALTVIDGSEEFPIRTWVAYEEAQRRFRAFFTQQHAAMASLVDDAIAPHARTGERMPERPWSLSAIATWLSTERELGLDLEQAIEVSVREHIRVDVPCGKCPTGAACVACGPTTRLAEPRAVASVRGRYRFDRTGKLIDEQTSGPVLVQSPRGM